MFEVGKRYAHICGSGEFLIVWVNDWHVLKLYPNGFLGWDLQDDLRYYREVIGD